MGKLDGKVAIVTGASRGISKAVAKDFEKPMEKPMGDPDVSCARKRPPAIDAGRPCLIKGFACR